MKKVSIAVLLLLSLLTACKENNPVLSIEGGLVQGVVTDSPGVLVFKGIPFAAPPVGELRWREPQPVVPWNGIRIADSFGSPAVQFNHTPGNWTPEFFYDGDPEFSEDCLYLNIWTPAAGKTNKKLPVCLWIHGGGYNAGWGHEPEMDGEEWAKHGCLLVTCNYRLQLLGFLTHPALSSESGNGVSGNYGLLDQIAALKWVRNNIEQFGGDPEKITIMGQSAGAMSVKTMVASPLSRDLVAGAIIQSGGGLNLDASSSDGALQRSELDGKKLMDWAGCETLEQMRALPAEEIITLPGRYMKATGERINPGTRPVVDGYALTKTFDEAARDNEISDVPYMIGGTLDDMGNLGGASILTFCLQREKDGGKPVYAYQFARRLPTDGREGVLEGAFHSSELWYMFKSLRFCWRPMIQGDYDLAEQMITFWTDFVKTGNPGDLWTPCNSGDSRLMVFRLDDEGMVASGMDNVNLL